MPRLRRRGRTLSERNTPESWRDYYLGELRARRFPLKLPRGRFYALLGLHMAEVQHERDQRGRRHA
jgi:hypothetical protein